MYVTFHKFQFQLFFFAFLQDNLRLGGRRGHGRMVVEFTTSGTKTP
jgi:hypothetical protein